MIYYQDSVKFKPELLDVQSAKDRIKREQLTAMYAPKLKDLRLAQKYDLYCYDRNVSTSVPKYVFTIIDSDDRQVLKKKTAAAFITPQGKER